MGQRGRTGESVPITIPAGRPAARRSREATLNDVRALPGRPRGRRTIHRDCAEPALGASSANTTDGFTARTDTLPRAVRDQLPATKDGRATLPPIPPRPVGEPLLTRTDPTVEATARYVLDAALDPLLPAAARPRRRAAVIRTTAVQTVTTLLVVRFRIELTCLALGATITQVAEDAQFLAFTSTGDEISWLDSAATDTLLPARPTGNVADELAAAQLSEALDRIPALHGHLARAR